MRFVFLLMTFLVLSQSAFAEEKTVSCSDKLLENNFHSVNIIKAMADYKAAMEAGYKGCSSIHGDKFEGSDDLRKFWQEKTDDEMTLAIDIFNYILVTEGVSEDTTEQCVEDASDKVLKFAENQYKKSYDRRYKMLTDDSVDLDFKTNDSCRWVVNSLEKYQDMYEKQPAMRNILFRVATGYSWLSKGADRQQKKAFKQFEKARKELAKLEAEAAQSQ